MKLIIHAGTHKTATTSFQYLCGKNTKLFECNGLYYPIIKSNKEDLGDIISNKINSTSQPLYNHSYLAWMIQSNQINIVNSLFKRFSIEAQKLKCTTVLISGEDFENVLIDYSMYEIIESIARDYGFTTIEWFFVKRNPYDYLISLYSELATQGFCLNLNNMYDDILNNGYYKASNKFYDWIFVFALEEKHQLFKNFRSCISKIVTFEDFLEGFTGKILLKNYLDTESIIKIEKQNILLPLKRVRKNKENVEFLYICNFLDAEANQENYNSNKAIIDALINYRLNKIKSLEENIKINLLDKF